MMVSDMGGALYLKPIFSPQQMNAIRQGRDCDVTRGMIEQSDALTLCHGLIQMTQNIYLMQHKGILKHIPLIAMQICKTWPDDKNQAEQCMRALDYLVTDYALGKSTLGIDMMYFVEIFGHRHSRNIGLWAKNEKAQRNWGQQMAEQSLTQPIAWALEKKILDTTQQGILWKHILEHRPQDAPAFYSHINHPKRDEMMVAKNITTSTLQELEKAVDWRQHDGKLVLHSIINKNHEAAKYVLSKIDIMQMARKYFTQINVVVILNTTLICWEFLDEHKRGDLIKIVNHCLQKEGAKKILKRPEYLLSRQMFQAHQQKTKMLNKIKDLNIKTHKVQEKRKM